MKSTKSWGGGGGIVCSIVWGGGVSCAFLGGGAVSESTNFIGGGVSLYHCVTCWGGGGIVCTSLYKMWAGGRYDVHNCGGGGRGVDFAFHGGQLYLWATVLVINYRDGGLQNGKIAGQKHLGPPSRQGKMFHAPLPFKLFAPPFNLAKTFSAPPFHRGKTSHALPPVL